MKVNYKLTILCCLATLFLFSCKVNQEALQQTTQRVESGSFRFEATSALPTGGKTINLTSNYDLKLSNDTLIAFLPYFGRAYTVNMMGEGGIKFTSRKFLMEKVKVKNGWEISIVTEDTQARYQLRLQINESGYATLLVQESSRQAISFYGRIE